MSEAQVGAPRSRINAKNIFIGLAILLILALMGFALYSGINKVRKFIAADAPAAAAAETPSSAVPAIVQDVQIRVSPLVLDATKCELHDFIVDKEGTLTVRPDSSCARLVTLEQLEKEKVAAAQASAPAEPNFTPAAPTPTP